MIDITVCQRLHNRKPRILADWGDRSHVRRFALIPLFLQLIAETLQAFVLPCFEKVAKMLTAQVSQEVYQLLERLIRLLYDQVQIEESDWQSLVR